MASLLQFFSKHLVVFAGLSLMLLFTGCGEKEAPTGTISGRLTIGDEPFGNCKICVQSSAVQFSGRAARVGEDGRYEVLDVPVGEFSVMIAPIPEIDDPMDPTPRPPSEAQVFNRVDRKYGSYETSGVSVSVKASQATQLNLDLSK